ncbi:MAG: DNA-processing protein DprA [Pseudomonadota bacterium]
MSAATLSENERLDWLRLARTRHVGPVAFAQLLARYGSPAKALDALPDLSRKAGRKRPLTAPPAGQIEDELNAVQRYGGRILASCEADYPAHLSALDPPPAIITVLGDVRLAANPCIAIVGARNASAAGRKIARDLAGALGEEGFTVVSGLARGIDGEAHAAALKTGTIAVLAGGIDHVYPPQHDRLYAAIASDGLIVSEPPFGYRATARDFPRRNRIVTGLSLGVVVVEAALRSGSLISARTAAEQGRDVFAVPGSPLDERSEGCNRLIRDGATLVTGAEDVIDALRAMPQRALFAPPSPGFNPETSMDFAPPEQVDRVREALTFTAQPIDEIARAAGIGAARCSAILMELELAGTALTLPGGLAARDPGD